MSEKTKSAAVGVEKYRLIKDIIQNLPDEDLVKYIRRSLETGVFAFLDVETDIWYFPGGLGVTIEAVEAFDSIHGPELLEVETGPDGHNNINKVTRYKLLTIPEEEVKN